MECVFDRSAESSAERSGGRRDQVFVQVELGAAGDRQWVADHRVHGGAVRGQVYTMDKGINVDIYTRCLRKVHTIFMIFSFLYLRPHGVVAGGILFYCRGFFLFLSFFSFGKGSPRWLYQQGTFIAQMVGYRCNFKNLVQNLGGDPH